MVITFERSSKTDKLKPVYTLRIKKGKLILKWTTDHHFNERFPLFPGLIPQRESSKNILNALNDDCVRGILLKLGEIDLHTVRDVCQRFETIAKSITPKHIRITSDNRTPLWKLENTLETFGPSIQTAYIAARYCSPTIVVGLLSRYCSKDVVFTF